MELNLVYSIMGLLGGIFCAIGDLFLDLKGKDNSKIGNSKVIESNWIKMATWRFKVSIILGCIGAFMLGLGIYSIAKQVAIYNHILTEVIISLAILTAMAGAFIHSFICIAPVIYKAIVTKGDADLAEYVINQVLDAIKVIFLMLYITIMLSTTCISIYCILNGLLDVPTWCIVLNPIAFAIVGIILRKIYPKWFYELPGIAMPSLGLGMIGLIGILNLM